MVAAAKAAHLKCPPLQAISISTTPSWHSAAPAAATPQEAAAPAATAVSYQQARRARAAMAANSLAAAPEHQEAPSHSPLPAAELLRWVDNLTQAAASAVGLTSAQFQQALAARTSPPVE